MCSNTATAKESLQILAREFQAPDKGTQIVAVLPKAPGRRKDQVAPLAATAGRVALPSL